MTVSRTIVINLVAFITNPFRKSRLSLNILVFPIIPTLLVDYAARMTLLAKKSKFSQEFSPVSAVGFDKGVDLGKTIAACRVRVWRRIAALPCFQDRRHQLPGQLHVVLPCKKRLVGDHAVQQKPLISLGQVGAEDLGIVEIHRQCAYAGF